MESHSQVYNISIVIHFHISPWRYTILLVQDPREYNGEAFLSTTKDDGVVYRKYRIYTCDTPRQDVKYPEHDRNEYRIRSPSDIQRCLDDGHVPIFDICRFALSYRNYKCNNDEDEIWTILKSHLLSRTDYETSDEDHNLWISLSSNTIDLFHHFCLHGYGVPIHPGSVIDMESMKRLRELLDEL